jgi:hypothetical protein
MSENLSWAPDETDAVLVGITITGYMGDDMISIDPAEPAIATTDVGPMGDTVRTYSANKLQRVTVNLIAGCASDVALRAAAEGRLVGPANMKNSSDRTQVTGATSYVSGQSPIKWSRGHQMRTWIIDIPQAKVLQTPP